MKLHSEMKILRLLLLLGLAWVAPAQSGDQAHRGDLALKIGNHAISAEVADTTESRERGLMQRTSLCTDCGMLFVFPIAARYGFWMKNTPLPISIAFIGSDGRVINIANMRPYSLDIHYAQGVALYALEMNRGWFAAHGVRPGDTVEGLQQDPAKKGR